MLFWTIQTTIISIILIFLVHNLLTFFKSTLTVPKVKDMLNSPLKDYDDIINSINSINSKNNISTNHNNSSINSTSISSIEPIPIDSNHTILPSQLYHQNDVNYMKNDLKYFLKNKLNTS
jgi:hypothetical protein